MCIGPFCFCRSKYHTFPILTGIHLPLSLSRTSRYSLGSSSMVLASPVYFYSIDAHLKAVIDRSVARWTEVKDKEFYYIVTAADGEKEAADTTIACFRGYADCVEGAKEMGVVYGMGTYEKGEVKGTVAMTEAYELGRRA